jgi:hypothetical protein
LDPSFAQKLQVEVAADSEEAEVQVGLQDVYALQLLRMQSLGVRSYT